MTRNAILYELHAARRQILGYCKGDLPTYLRDVQARLEASAGPITQRTQRTNRCTRSRGPRALVRSMSFAAAR